MIIREMFKRHMVLFALLAGLILGSLNNTCDCPSPSTEVSVPESNSMHSTSCMDNPGLCAMPPEVLNKMLTRALISKK